MEIKRTPAGRSFILCLSPVCFFFLSILLQGLPCGSSGQILVVAWRILSEMLCRSFIVLRRSMVGHTLYFTREHTARWVQKCGVPVTARNTTFHALKSIAAVVFMCYIASVHTGPEWCQTGAPLLISVPSRGGSSRHWPVLPVWYLLSTTYVTWQLFELVKV